MPLITYRSGRDRIHIGWDKFIIIYVRMCMCTHVCIHVSVDGWMDGWTDGWMHVCMYTWSCMMMHDHLWWCICMIMYDYMHVDMEVWMCGCMYHYVSMYTQCIILKIDYNPCIEYSPHRCSSCCMSHLRHPVGMSRVYSSYASQMTFIWKFPKIGVPPKVIHFNRIFHCKPSILGNYPHWWKPPNNGSSERRTLQPRPSKPPGAPRHVPMVSALARLRLKSLFWSNCTWGCLKMGDNGENDG